MDPIDAKILNLLQEDCSRSLAELGRAVGLSTSGVNERLKRLRARGEPARSRPEAGVKAAE